MPSAILDSKCKSRFFTLYILLICGDINPNPGPQWKFPCGVCPKPVRSNQQRIQCDYCGRWYHSKCCMNDLIYDALANSTCLWICCDCGLWRHQIVFLHWRTCIFRHKIWMILYHIKHQEDFQVQHRLPRRPQGFRLHNPPKKAVA